MQRLCGRDFTGPFELLKLFELIMSNPKGIYSLAFYIYELYLLSNRVFPAFLVKTQNTINNVPV